jgi:hypothetical protein
VIWRTIALIVAGYSAVACAAAQQAVTPEITRAIESKCGVEDVTVVPAKNGPPAIAFAVRDGSGRENTAYDCVARELEPYSFKGLIEAQVPANYKKPAK